MKLDENFEIKKISNYWTLYYAELNSKTGKTSKNKTFHMTLKQGLESYCDAALDPCESVVEVLAKIDELHAVIDKIEKR